MLYGKNCDRFWADVHSLQAGDVLSSLDGNTLAVEKCYDSGNYETVYNCRVADYHTYFVGDERWGWSLWTHNANRNCVGPNRHQKKQGDKKEESTEQTRKDQKERDGGGRQGERATLDKLLQRANEQVEQAEEQASGNSDGADSRKLTPVSVEHKAARWQEYQERGGSWSYERWSKQYDVNMQNATGPLLREAEYRTALGGENRILDTPLGATSN